MARKIMNLHMLVLSLRCAYWTHFPVCLKLNLNLQGILFCTLPHIMNLYTMKCVSLSHESESGDTCRELASINTLLSKECQHINIRKMYVKILSFTLKLTLIYTCKFLSHWIIPSESRGRAIMFGYINILLKLGEWPINNEG